MASFFCWRRVARLLIAVSFCLIAAWNIWPELPASPYSTIPGPPRHLRTSWSTDGQVFYGVQLVSNQQLSHIWQAWEVSTGRLRTKCEPIRLPAHSFIFDPKDRIVIAADFNSNALIVWDAKTAKRLKCIDLPSGVDSNYGFQISPDASTLTMFRPHQEGADVHLWNLPEFTPRTILKGQSWPLAFSPDGQLIATTQHKKHGTSHINLWKLTSGEQSQLLDHRPSDVVAGIHVGRSGYLAFSADGTRLGISGSHDDEEDRNEYLMVPLTRFRVWNVASGSIVNEYRGDVQFHFNAAAAAWDHVYTHQYGSDQTQHNLAHAANGNPCVNFKATGGPELPILQCFATTFRIEPCASRPYVAINEYLGQSNQLKPLKYFSSVVEHLLKFLGVIKFSGLRGQIQMLEVGREEPLFVLNGQRFLSFSQDGRFFATEGYDNDATYIYRMMPDRPWWILIAGSLSFIFAIELGWWIAALTTRLFF